MHVYIRVVGGGVEGVCEGEENDVQNLVRFCISLLPSIQNFSRVHNYFLM